jgi:16S rRNA (adenine1518-N6/adenine1519-N6)-dimethyltransferase
MVMAQTLTDIKNLLAGHGLHPKKRFGQNFLHDGNHMRRIMDAADVGEGELILEVGPGTGALSERLLEAGAELVAVEIDRDMEPILRDRLSGFGDRFRLHIGDVLESKHTLNPAVIELLRTAPDSDPSPIPHPSTPFKMIANLPYNIASPLLVNLAVDHPGMSTAVVMIQREVAERITAKPGRVPGGTSGGTSGGASGGGKDYGPLSVILQAMCLVDVVGTLSPECFWPRPKVASAVVRLVRRATPLTDDPAALSGLLQKLFQKRRKQLGAILGRDRALPGGIDPKARPESLCVEQFVELARWLS